MNVEGLRALLESALAVWPWVSAGVAACATSVIVWRRYEYRRAVQRRLAGIRERYVLAGGARSGGWGASDRASDKARRPAA